MQDVLAAISHKYENGIMTVYNWMKEAGMGKLIVDSLIFWEYMYKLFWCKINTFYLKMYNSLKIWVYGFGWM